MYTGSIVDFYDDPQGLVLKERLPEDQVPDFIKQAEYLDDGTRSRLPDDVFALVMLDQGEKLRKYACTDKGNTALNVIYFMEHRDRLPEEAQKVAAANLAQACAWYGLDVPLGLHKEAGMTSLLKKPGKLMSGAMMASDVSGRAGQGVERHRASMSKYQDLIGSEIMPTSSSTPEKTAALQPYVDVTGKKPPVKVKQASAERFCLVKTGQARFPIDSYGQIKQASVWFDEYGQTLHPEERREYCTKLAARAGEVGIDVSDLIKKYGAPGYATDGEVNVAVCTRMQHWAEDSPERDMLQSLMEKAASVPPEVFCEALRQFDEATGMDYLWDAEIYDPWYSTYGFQKQARWVWESGNDRLTEEQLKLSAKKDFRAICDAFGQEMAEEYRKNPQQIFDSLPLDSKRIIARMANDPQ